MPDLIVNGEGMGGIASKLLQHNGDPNSLRPYIGADGRHYITTMVVNSAGNIEPKTVLVGNTYSAMLRKNDWIAIDEAVVRVALPRLQAFGDLGAAGLQYTIPNGMSKTTFEYEAMTDIGRAQTSMDGVRRGNNERPNFDLRGLPLPIIHKDFSYNLRQILASRNGGSPLDTTTAELAARKVAEECERYTLGLNDAYAFAGYSIYGYTNFPQRLTKTLTLPTAAGWTPDVLVREVLAMRQQAVNAYHYGPYMLYLSTNFDQYLDDDYSAAKGDGTLRDRLKKITNIKDVRTLDYLTGYQVLLVQMTSDVVRSVVGMGMTTVQWESQGGMEINFKVMCIMVPQLRYDTNGNTGIVHGTAA